MSRIVQIATAAVTYRSQDLPHPLAMREEALHWVDQAGRQGADIVCLPEYCCAAFDANNGKWQAEMVPGPATDAAGKLAAKHGLYVIVPLVEDAGQAKPYNTAVLLDRRGHIVGSYRKTHLCLPDVGEGDAYLPGDELPVFQTDFGKIGLSICMDLHYPELYSVLALGGAEIIFWPTGAMDYTGDLLESVVNARAADNQVFFVCSHYVQLPYLTGKMHGRSRVVDPMGRIRADTGHFPGLALACVDLEQTYPMWYQGKMLQKYPTMRQTLFKTRRPELYGPLIEPVQPRHWQRSDAPAVCLTPNQRNQGSRP